MTDHESMTEGRLEFRRTLSAPIDTVWRFLTEDELRGKWLCHGDVEPREGGTIEFKFNPENLGHPRPDGVPEDRYTADFSGTVLIYDPPHCLSFLWPGAGPGQETRVTFKLTEKGGQTELHLVHDRITSDRDHVGAAAGWHAHLEQLVCHFSGAIAPNFWTHHDEMEDAYRETLSALRAKG